MRLGAYEVLSPIGAGGMGEVYRARDTRLGREVAIKVLPADRVSDADRRRRFVQEAQAASALNHPHIITIYEIESADDNDFIVMEYVRGKSLDALIPRQGMRLNEALRIAIAVADAFAAAHARGIIHRDLKPANVIVGTDGAVEVLDFGLAKLMADADTPDDDSPTLLGVSSRDISTDLQLEPGHRETRSPSQTLLERGKRSSAASLRIHGLHIMGRLRDRLSSCGRDRRKAPDRDREPVRHGKRSHSNITA